jgi:hypothetical protein
VFALTHEILCEIKIFSVSALHILLCPQFAGSNVSNNRKKEKKKKKRFFPKKNQKEKVPKIYIPDLG